ncbi:hypothetical protein IFO69_11140 [Echinicola sp. CAU 1574]|uniref:Uncharacterized protein n=1 Tax=Echinicola arenosa TaxID=2774144 RepID=A0ABR9AKJ2_9BACT|nr:hypothetical protein [Echinicola arenosa]MBD8489301.1 hypothetical protein [Echinicola arenosa]
MGKLSGVLKFVGSLSDITVVKRGNEFIVRKKKPKIGKKKYKKDPAYVESRKMNDEFGRASSLATAFRRFLEPECDGLVLGYLHSRLSAAFRKVMLTDQAHKRGIRKLFDGELELLKGFEIAKTHRVAACYYDLPDTHLVSDSPMMRFDFSKSTALIKDKVPKAASHFELVPMVLVLDEQVPNNSYLTKVDLAFHQIDGDLSQLGEVFVPFRPHKNPVALFSLLKLTFIQKINNGYNVLYEDSGCRVLDVVLLK